MLGAYELLTFLIMRKYTKANWFKSTNQVRRRPKTGLDDEKLAHCRLLSGSKQDGLHPLVELSLLNAI